MAIRQADSPADLVNRVKAGDPQAKVEIVERYDRGIRFIIRQDVNDHAAADDIYQETFRIVFEKIRRGEVREPEKLTGFVWAVVRNLIIRYFRRTARQAQLVEAEGQESFPHPAPDQLEMLLQKEKDELVRQVFNRMRNKRDIQVLFRFYIIEESKQQICADLGLTNLDFNHIIYRARNRYRKLYEEVLRRE
ncbi:MAG TPA: sigma-70 family RNA polymerase sigma factor [Blastocatellia bacterium]|nr:sigma-70 family RNA polymerase sigma factor [Blastocatellia bacterium]